MNTLHNALIKCFLSTLESKTQAKFSMLRNSVQTKKTKAQKNNYTNKCVNKYVNKCVNKQTMQGNKRINQYFLP
jgi:hypothetical protein